MENENVLEGYKCPNCGATDDFNIVGEALFLHVMDDGVSEFEGVEWEDTSSCVCDDCGHSATVAEFKGLPAPKKTRPMTDEEIEAQAIIEAVDEIWFTSILETDEGEEIELTPERYIKILEGAETDELQEAAIGIASDRYQYESAEGLLEAIEGYKFIFARLMKLGRDGKEVEG